MQNKKGPYGPVAAVVLMSLAVSVVILSCKNPEGAPLDNTAPTTRLANVPPNDTIAQYIRLGVIPELTLFWIGDDPDGFVTAYRYRWTNLRRDGTLDTNDWTTILNVTTLGGQSIPNSILVREDQPGGIQLRTYPGSIFRMYNFLVTLTPLDTDLVRIISDSLATRRPFPVPYKTGNVAGDTIYGGNNDQNQAPTKGTFIFDSPADSNRHKFEVRSVDNKDVEDPSSAIVNFWTKESPGPTARFINGGVPPNDGFAIRCVTETFTGLRFAFGAIDPSTFQQEFSWSVDDTINSGRWNTWDPAEQALVTALDFQHMDADTHIFYLRARNRWGVVSPVIDTFFTATVPAFDSSGFVPRTLIINNNRTAPITGSGGLPVGQYNPDSNMVKAFYGEMMDSLGKTGQFTIWTTQSRAPAGSFPPRRFLGDYSSIVLVSERRLGSGDFQYGITGVKQDLLRQYLNVGGKLVVSGPPDIAGLIGTYPTWADQVFHILFLIRDGALDFVGSKGSVVGLGYPDFALDTTKIHPDSVAISPTGERLRAIRGINMNMPRGFGKTISLFNSGRDSVLFENQPLGIQFLAPQAAPGCRPIYSVVFFACPLYYAEKSGAVQSLRQAFIDIDE